jgi:hypothetical protein
MISLIESKNNRHPAHASYYRHSRESGNPWWTALRVGPRLRGDDKLRGSILKLAPMGFIPAMLTLQTLTLRRPAQPGLEGSATQFAAILRGLREARFRASRAHLRMRLENHRLTCQ